VTPSPVLQVESESDEASAVTFKGEDAGLSCALEPYKNTNGAKINAKKKDEVLGRMVHPSCIPRCGDPARMLLG
jgi:hypothetical protein